MSAEWILVVPGSLSQKGVLDDRATIMAFGPVIRDAILLRLKRARIADPALPVRVALEAFSPFIPHEPDDSSLPVAILRSAWSGVLAASGFRYHGGRQTVEIPGARGASLLLGHGQLNLRALGAPERAGDGRMRLAIEACGVLFAPCVPPPTPYQRT